MKASSGSGEWPRVRVVDFQADIKKVRQVKVRRQARLSRGSIVVRGSSDAHRFERGSRRRQTSPWLKPYPSRPRTQSVGADFANSASGGDEWHVLEAERH